MGSAANQVNSPSATYFGIDLFKFICALLLVGVHTSAFSQIFILDMGYSTLTRVLVPFFLVCSAFFYFKKKNSWSRILFYVKRIAILYAIWSLIYFLVDIIISGFSLSIFQTFLFEFFITGYKHFWYLHASIVGLAFIAILDLLTKSKKKLIFAIALILYVIGTLCSTYVSLFSGNAVLNAIVHNPIIEVLGTRNGIFYAPVYMALGYCAALSSKAIKPKMSLLGLVIGYAALALEGAAGVLVLHTSSTVLWFFMLPVTYFLFNFAKEITIPPCRLFVRKASTFIYCVHPVIITAFSYFGFGNFVNFIVVCIISFVISYIAYVLLEKCHWSFLKYLF